MKKHIPNLFTSFNLFSGCIASVMALEGIYNWVVFFVILSAVFDFFDGFLARILHAYSPIGKELDSLADMISFGLVPGLLVFRYLTSHTLGLTSISFLDQYIPYIAFLLTVFSALRLAKFNLDERQSASFIGLPTPANALFWISFCYGLNKEIPNPSHILIFTIIGGVILFSLLLTAEIPMFSLKIKNLYPKGNEQRYILAIIMIVAICWIGILGIAIGILTYIGLSIANYKKIE